LPQAENREQNTFPELRSFTLQSLSELIGFYTNGPLPGEQVSNKLFDEKVYICLTFSSRFGLSLILNFHIFYIIRLKLRKKSLGAYLQYYRLLIQPRL